MGLQPSSPAKTVSLELLLALFDGRDVTTLPIGLPPPGHPQAHDCEPALRTFLDCRAQRRLISFPTLSPAAGPAVYPGLVCGYRGLGIHNRQLESGKPRYELNAIQTPTNIEWMQTWGCMDCAGLLITGRRKKRERDKKRLDGWMDASEFGHGICRREGR